MRKHLGEKEFCDCVYANGRNKTNMSNILGCVRGNLFVGWVAVRSFALS